MPKQASPNRPLVIVNAVAERGALSAPGFERSAAQPAWGWLPGCSGNVVPGAPGSASAGLAVSASTAMLRPVVVIRFIAPPWVALLLIAGCCVPGAVAVSSVHAIQRSRSRAWASAVG